MKILATLLLLSLIALAPNGGRAEDKRIVMIAGKPSHGPGEHEHRAGLLLFQKCLAGFPGIQVEVYSNGWPASSDVLKGAAAIIIYSDGGAGHPALQDDHLQQLGALMKQGVGLACIHYAVEPTIEKVRPNSLTGSAAVLKSTARSIPSGRPISNPCRIIPFRAA